PVDVKQPFLHCRSVVWITRQAERYDLDLLVRSILERIRRRARIDQASRWTFVRESHRHVAREAKSLRWLAKRKHRDRVAVNVAQPAHIGLRLNLEPRADDLHVMPFARPHQSAMRTQLHGRMIEIRRLMKNSDAFHAHRAACSWQWRDDPN